MIQLDGSTLEGGGQLIRNALALSALTSQDIKISRIRGNRRGGGGLRASHTAAVKFLLEVCGGEAIGAHQGSSELSFYPRGQSTTQTKKGAKDASCEDDDRDSSRQGQILRNFSTEMLPVKPEYNIRLQTPGSVFLIFQALYPYLLYAGACAEGELPTGDSHAQPIRVNITGGTNTTSSPSYDYISQVLIPNFAKLGLPRLAVHLNSRGWCTGRVELGKVSFTIEPLRTYGDAKTDPEDGGSVKLEDDPPFSPTRSSSTRIPTFPRIQLSDFERGHITKVDVTVLAPNITFEQMESREDSKERNNPAKGNKPKKTRKEQRGLGPEVFEDGEPAEESSSAFQGPDATWDSPGQQTVRDVLGNRAISVLSKALGMRGVPKHDIPTETTSGSGPTIKVHHSEATRHPMHIYLLIVAHTSTGFRLGRDALYGVDDKGTPMTGGKGAHGSKKKGIKSKRPSAKPSQPDPETRIDNMVNQCVSDLMYELDNGDMRCLDSYMRDQVVVFQALGHVGERLPQEKSTLLQSDEEEELSLHARTGIWVSEQILGVKV